MKSRILHINRVTLAANTAIFLLGLLSLVILVLPRFHFARHSLELSAALESISIVVSLGAFFLCFARFRATSELRLLLLALAFLVLSFYSLVLDIVVPFLGEDWNITIESLAYFWLIARTGTALLLLASLRAGSSSTSFNKGIAGAAAALGSVSLLAVGILINGTGILPDIVSPSAAELLSGEITSGAITGLTAFGIVSHILTGLVFLAAGIGYMRLYHLEKRPFWGWLSISFVAAFFTQINFMIFPSIFVGYVFPGDFIRLFSRLALLMGTYAEMAYAYRQTKSQNLELHALQDISILGMGRTDTGEILAGINDTVRRVFDAEAVFMLFQNESGDELIARGPAVGLDESQVAGLRIPLSEECLAVDTFKRGATTVSSDPDRDCISIALQSKLYIESALISSLRTGNQTLGLLLVINKKGGGFGEEEVRFLTIIAGRAAMIIENADLHEQLEAAAVIEERTRLAREIHDGLAQNLGYLNLKLPQVLEDISQNKEKALAELKSMRVIVQESLTEARQTIVDLQAPVDPERDFLKTVANYAREFSAAASIEVEVDARENEIHLQPSISKELVRIIQEALNNVRRHAEARRVKIGFTRVDGRLRMEIVDDGKGFSPDQAPGTAGRWGHFGIQSMKGRAARLGGRLEISSVPDEGTAVTLDIPLEEGGPWTG